jgi:hypothetical protein
LAQTGTISYEAAGILLDMCSRPSEWIIHKNFYRNKSCGRDAMNKIFMELQLAGYLKIKILREKGKITDNVWYVSNKPIYEPPSRSTEKPDAGKTGRRQNRTPGKQHLYNKENKENKENIKSKESISCRKTTEIDFSPDFELSWKAYPLREGTNNKRDAWKQWQARLKEGEVVTNLQIATEHFAQWVKDSGNERTPFVMQAQRFYGKSRQYEEFIQPKLVLISGNQHAINSTSDTNSNKQRKDGINRRIDEITADVDFIF